MSEKNPTVMENTNCESPVDFAALIMQMGRGTTQTELSEALRDLVEKVQATGKPGALTYTLKVDLLKGTTAVQLTDTIKTRLPKFDRASSIFYVDTDGSLTRDDPAQTPLFEIHEN